MKMALPPPLKPWMRKRIREAAKADSEAEVLKALIEVSRSHSVFVETEFAICDDTVTVLQRDRKIAFPRPLQRENHRTILIGYLECIASKYQFEEWCEVAPGDVVIDCGAYVGGFARSVVEEAGRTVVIEPAPANYECCVSNLDGFSNAGTYQIGLFDQTGILPLQMSRSSVDHSLLSPDRGATGTTLDVETLRLDDLAARLDLKRIDFFKLEAEGAEIEAIEGMGDLRPGKIAIDAGPERYGESPMGELIEMLASRGYETRSRGNVLYAVHGFGS